MFSAVVFVWNIGVINPLQHNSYWMSHQRRQSDSAEAEEEPKGDT